MAASEIDTRVERARNCLQDLSVMPTYTLRQASLDGGITIEDSEMGLERVFEAELGLPVSLEKGGDSGDRLLVSGTLDPRDYNPRAWCYDTPGLESPDQVVTSIRIIVITPSVKVLYPPILWLSFRRSTCCHRNNSLNTSHLQAVKNRISIALKNAFSFQGPLCSNLACRCLLACLDASMFYR